MTPEEHKQRHEKLHKALDELLKDFIVHTGKMPSKTSLIEFLSWSGDQTVLPTELVIEGLPENFTHFEDK
jgi:hypothetical protein